MQTQHTVQITQLGQTPLHTQMQRPQSSDHIVRTNAFAYTNANTTQSTDHILRKNTFAYTNANTT